MADPAVKTSIMLSGKLWQRTKVRAAQDRTTPSALVAEGLRLVLKKPKKGR